MKKLVLASILSASLAVPALADDDYTGILNVPREQWLSTSDIVQKIEAKGYQVREIEVDAGAYEFEGTDSAGARIEGYAHPATGEILSTRPDND